MRPPTAAARLAISAGPLAESFKGVLDRLRRQRVVARIRDRDPTLWPASPGAIADRLGWLRGADHPGLDLKGLRAFPREAETAGFRQAVLLGMGGSSLGAATLAELLPGDGQGGVELTTLDSTAPDWIRAVTARAEERPTLFLVASKSGTTTEVACLAEHFFRHAEDRRGKEAGQAFVAITDPGSPLGATAAARGFRRTFENPPDLGGRFSVLSFFGLVPAALAGRSLERVIAGAREMAAACREPEPEANPGACLGALLAAAAESGRDKLVLGGAPRLTPFAAWAEQLVAESTGKQGRGLLPVLGEPELPPEALRDDRLFVLLGAGDGAEQDVSRRLAAAGRPAVRVEIGGAEALGAELFRWMFAVAAAGHLLGIDPFEQPDVEATKELTRRLLDELAAGASGVGEGAEADPAELARALPEASYFAVSAFASPDPALEAAIAGLRRLVVERTGAATTFGYGPRFLHSTGQLHKGGPPGGVHLQLRAREAELPIPGRPYGFSALLRAQAEADARTLRDRGRVALALELGGDGASVVERFTRRLAAALAGGSP